VLADGTAEYTPGVSRTASSTTTFAHAGLKNTSTQSAENETVAATQVYDAFGNEVSTSGSWSGAYGYGSVFGYETDGSGLHLLGRRSYDSSQGRFLTRDPAYLERNEYAYVDSSPVLFADPDGCDGLNSIVRFLGLLAGAVGHYLGLPHVVDISGRQTDDPRPIGSTYNYPPEDNPKPKIEPKPTGGGGRGTKPPGPILPSKEELKKELKRGRGKPPTWLKLLRRLGRGGRGFVTGVGIAIIAGEAAADAADEWDDPYQDAYDNIRMPEWALETD
jgi:RHS repeat-associated protein